MEIISDGMTVRFPNAPLGRIFFAERISTSPVMTAELPDAKNRSGQYTVNVAA